MRVLLVGPDLETNVSLGYLAASLQAAGHQATIAPYNTSEDAPSVMLLAGAADLIGLSLSFQVRAPQFFALAAALKQAFPHTPIVGGGHFATCAAEQILRDYPDLDLIALHEAEDTLVELAGLGDTLLERALGVPGVIVRQAMDDGDDENATGCQRSPPRAVRRDLESLPTPDRSGPARLLAGVPTAYLMGSRGCVRSCDYCCIATLHHQVEGPRFRRRSPEHIAAEMGLLFRKRGVRQFVFHDDNFLVPNQKNNRERLGQLGEAMRREDIGVTDPVGLVMKSGPRDVSEEALSKLIELGLLRIFLGIESSSQQGMDSLGRRQSPAEAEAAVSLCEKLSLSSQYTMIIFHPEASVETMLSDLAFVERHPTHPLNYCRAELYAETPLERRLLAQGRCEGSYLARSYRYTDPLVARVWALGKDRFAGRCWGQDELLGQVIRLDHQAAVLRHFYEGRAARETVRDFLSFETQLNLETAGFFRELVLLCGEAPSQQDPTLHRALEALGRREQAARTIQLERLCQLRARIDALSRPLLDLARSASSERPPAASRLSLLPRHAAAVLVAAGLAGAAGCAGHRSVDGVAEAAPPPYEEPLSGPPPESAESVQANAADKKDKGSAKQTDTQRDKQQAVPEVATPDLRVREDLGVAEAAPPPYLKDRPLLEPVDPVRIQDGVAEAAPPPFPDKPAQINGKMNLKVEGKPGLRVLLDGRKIGYTPLRQEVVSVGTHLLRLVDKERGIDFRRRIQIKERGTTTLILKLPPAPKSPPPPPHAGDKDGGAD